MTEPSETFLDYVRPHLRKLYSIAIQYVTQKNEAQDLVQETLLRAWKTFSSPAIATQATYRPAWLFVIMRNVALDWQRSAHHKHKVLLTTDLELTETVPFDPTEPFASLPSMTENQFRDFLDDQIAFALDALEPSYKEVIILSVVGELRYREIAQVLDCPIGTVMSRMARARRDLRERLSNYAQSRRLMKEGRP